MKSLFSDQTSKIHTLHQTWPVGRKLFHHYLSFLRLERKQKNSSNEFRILIFLFRSYSFGIKMITTFICSRSSLENHTRCQTKMCKVYTRFQTKKAQKPYPLGWHIRICLILGCTPPRGGEMHAYYICKVSS